MGIIYFKEIKFFIKKLKNNKAAGIDEIPPGLWKIIAKDGDALQFFANLCNHC